MTKQTEVLKLALEALESLRPAYGWGKGAMQEKAITAIREALAEQPAQPEVAMVDAAMVEMKNIVPPLRRSDCQRLIMAALNAAPQPAPVQQEPKKDLMYSTVAMQERHAAFVDRAVATLEQAKREALAEQPAQQEPVAWKHDCAALLQNDVELWVDRCPHCGKPRTTPQAQPAQRKPLTDEQIVKCWGQVSGTRYGYVAFARAIEAAHGITKGGAA